MSNKTAKLEVIAADRDGFAPVLKLGEGCIDKRNGVWHFCAPDGARFACGGRGAQTHFSLEGGFTPKPPGFCSLNDERIANPWNIINREWVKS